MFTSYNRIQCLRTALFGTVMLFALIGTKSVSAQGLTSDGKYYDDGKLTWSRIEVQGNYQTAVQTCEKISGNGAKWQVPTSDQVKHFYQQIYMNKALKESLRLSFWRLDTIWTATRVSDTDYETADLYRGYLRLNLSPESYSPPNYLACVRPTVGPLNEWTEIGSGPNSSAEAEQYCRKVGVDWKLPTRLQLEEYAKKATLTHLSTIDNDPRLIPLWTSDGSLINLLGTKFDDKVEHANVICVRTPA